MSTKRHLAGLLAAALISVSAPVLAEQIKFSADLTPAAETPATDSTGTGTVDATLDTDTHDLTWSITYSGLTGEATAAHFHGPAAVGAKAPPVVPISGSLGSPIKGSATVTDAQQQDLQNGLWYFNVHTAKYPDGEIRGQLTQAGADGDTSSSAMSSTDESVPNS